MSRPPPNPWMQEPLPPRHIPPHHPQDHQTRDAPLRLPPPSSLVGGASSTEALSRGREPAHARNQYPDQYAASALGGRFTALEPDSSSRRQPDLGTRLSSTHSPTAEDGSRSMPDSMRPPRDLAREQSSSCLLQFQCHSQQNQGLSNDGSYPQNYVRRPQPGYPARDARLERSHQAMLPPRYPQPAQGEQHREPGRMSIYGLLSSDNSRAEVSTSSKAPVRQHPSSLAARGSKYKIKIRQQPVAARSCGFGERDRRVIDPPPILQMIIEDPNASHKDISTLIRYPYAVIHCTIWSEDGTEDCSAMPEEYRSTRRLMGTTVSSPFVGQDENNEEGCFFCFPDLSCRTPGTFRLKFALVVLDPVAGNGMKTPLAATVMSEAFKVYNAKDFPGMQASTALTKKLKEQGCLISIKKGNERTSSTHARDSGDEEDEDDEEEATSRGQRAAKRARRA
ncbi:hypothetical protein DL769_000972 [Monosporascus sp. CRB-8-3]|nr:hypothetical protein DL769_000972 [Monosporascus sp. CRB-8-3]